MAVTTEYSDVATGQRTGSPAVDSDLFSGRIVQVTFAFTQGPAAGDALSLAVLCRTPTGRARFLSLHSWMRHSALGVARLLSLGWLAYVDERGVQQAQNLTGITSALDVAAIGVKHVGLTTTPGQSFLFETPRWLVAQVTGGTIPAGATLSGTFEFAQG